MTAAMDDKEFTKTERSSSIPKKNSELRADRNRWFLVVIAMLGYIGFQQYQNHENFVLAQTNKEVVFVKLYPDGTSDVGEFKPGDETQFFRSTIDSAFELFVKSRYGVQPETVRKDFGIAGVFMSQPMYNSFTSTQDGGFDAAQKATDIEANKNADRVEIVWGFADHYDTIPAVFNKKKGEMVRSNIHYTEITKTAAGIVKPGGVKQKIMRAQWRLLTKKELATHSQKWLRVNPVGVEIVQQDVIDDPSANNGPEGKAQ